MNPLSFYSVSRLSVVMGTVIYQNLMNFLLEEQDYSLDEIVEIAHERFGFDKEKTRSEVMMTSLIFKDSVQLLPNNKYRRIEDFGDISWMLGFIGKAPPGYFEARPGLKKLYEEFEKKYGWPKTHSPQ